MLKLNASYSKKIPAETEYSSKSYHAAVEVEIPDGLTIDQLQERIHATFELVRTSVEAELDGSAGQQANASQPTAAKADTPAPTAAAAGQVAESKPRADEREPASKKQLRYLVDLARKRELDADDLDALARVRHGASTVYDLSKAACSKLIDEVRGQRKAA